MDNKEKYQGRFSSSKRKKRSAGRKLIYILGAVVLALVLLIAGMMLHLNIAEKKLEKRAAAVENYTSPVTTSASVTTAAEGTTLTTETEATIPTETKPKVILDKYAESFAENPEMVGWIKMGDTKLNYPVMHTPDDPQKYLHTGFENEYSYPGVPFLDASCTMDSDNLIIYGHNMANGTMFRSLFKYQEKPYWENHPTISFDTLYEEQEFEILAAFYDRVYLKTETDVFKFYQFIDAESEEDFDYAVAQFKEKSLYDTGVEAHYGDQLITLVTCAYHTEDGRFVVVARKAAQ